MSRTRFQSIVHLFIEVLVCFNISAAKSCRRWYYPVLVSWAFWRGKSHDFRHCHSHLSFLLAFTGICNSSKGSYHSSSQGALCCVIILVGVVSSIFGTYSALSKIIENLSSWDLGLLYFSQAASGAVKLESMYYSKIVRFYFSVFNFGIISSFVLHHINVMSSGKWDWYVIFCPTIERGQRHFEIGTLSSHFRGHKRRRKNSKHKFH